MHRTRPTLRHRLSLALLALAAAACGGGDPAGPVPVASVALSGAPTAPVVVGATVQLAAQALDAEGRALADRAIEWRSSDEAIVRVDAAGLVSTVAAGRATVRATSGAAADSATVDVRAGGVVGREGGAVSTPGGGAHLSVPGGALAEPATITFAPVASPPADARLVAGTVFEIGPAGLAFAKAATLSLAYAAAFAPAGLPAGVDETSLQLYQLVDGAWRSLPASVPDTGVNKVMGEITTTGTYAVLATPVARIALSGVRDPDTVVVSEGRKLVAIAFDAAGNAISGRTLTYFSTDEAIAQIDQNGNVVAKAIGTTSLGARLGGQSASVVLVVRPEPVVEITISGAPPPQQSPLVAGETLQLTATLRDRMGNPLSGREVSWSSSAPGVATVSGTGLVTSLGAGVARITAASEGRSAFVQLAVDPLLPNDCPGEQEWGTSFGNRCRTSYVPGTLDPSDFQVAWDTVMPVKGVATLGPQLFYTGGAGFNTNHIGALSAATGDALWSHVGPSPFDIGAPAAAAGRVVAYVADVYVGSDAVLTLGPTTGTISRTPIGTGLQFATAPIFDGDDLLYGGRSSGVVRVNPFLGATVWSAPLASTYVAPSVSGRIVYAYESGPVLLDRTSGRRLWKVSDASPYPSAAFILPVLGSQNRVVVQIAGRLAAYDVALRTRLWSVTGSFSGLPVVHGGVVYVTRGTVVEARSETDGSVLWSWTAPSGVTTLYGMLLTDNLLFVSTATRVYAIDLATRADVWNVAATGESLAMSGQQGMLYVVSQLWGRLTAIRVR